MGVAWKLIRQEVTANLPKSLTHWHGSWGVLSLGGTDVQGFFFLPWLHGNLPDWQQQDVPSWSASSSVLHSGICGFIIIFFCFWGFFFFLVRQRQLLNEIWWNLPVYKLISLIPWKCWCNSKELSATIRYTWLYVCTCMIKDNLCMVQ